MCKSAKLVLNLVRLHDTDSAWFLTYKEKSYYKYPFWACKRCQVNLSRIAKISMYNKKVIRSEINLKDIAMSPTRRQMVKKIRDIKNLFPEEISSISLIPYEYVPEPFSKKVNVAISFKNLCLINYLNHVIDTDENLLDSWKTVNGDEEISRSKFFRARIARILIALAKVHTLSDEMAIWIWSNTRIISIEFFCKHPASMVQTTPDKVLKIK